MLDKITLRMWGLTGLATALLYAALSALMLNVPAFHTAVRESWPLWVTPGAVVCILGFRRAILETLGRGR